ncbi:hypothetical protein [Streptomyces uncialis]|uniref:hypothetical protein n=1 Tax=Streptomyces uncialis TaxID=1048205 RepID=UPI00340E1A65
MSSAKAVAAAIAGVEPYEALAGIGATATDASAAATTAAAATQAAVTSCAVAP